MEKKFKRQAEDYILTDLLPVEKGNYYTHKFFYEFLLTKNLQHLIKNCNFSSEKLCKPNFHAAPLKFRIRKKNGFRELSILNPLSIIESYFFIQVFGNNIIQISSKENNYSQRTPEKVKQLLYKHKNGQTVYYSNEEDKNQLLLNLEASGSFYNHKPVKRLHSFESGRYNAYLQDKYLNVLRFDIENFFGSIYTHSYTWLIANNYLDSIALNKVNSLYPNIDTFLQNINGSKTNGIVVGPEISRLLANFLLVKIEKQIDNGIKRLGYKKGKDYDICRFVDDYFLYTNDKYKQKKIFECFETILNEYHLKINSSKTAISFTSEYSNEWIDDTKNLASSVISELFVSNNSAETVEPKIKKSDRKYVSIKNKVQVILKNTNERTKVASYLLTTIVGLTEHNQDKKINTTYLDFINLCFYLVSLHPGYVSVQKLVSILSCLMEYEDMEKEFIERGIYRFGNKIFSGYISDWINLLLFMGANNIRLPKEMEESILKEYLNSTGDLDPRLIAGIYIYCDLTSDRVSRKEILKKIEDIICFNIKQININYFFQDKASWWIIIFRSCPSLGETVINNMDDILNKINPDSSSLSGKSQNMVKEFLQVGGGFIDWEFSNKSYFKKMYYYTRKRTIFNPIMEDFLDISR